VPVAVLFVVAWNMSECARGQLVRTAPKTDVAVLS